MAKAGRRRSVVWECFTEHPTSGKRRVLCRFCNHDTVANPTRMVRHIVKYCPEADESHKRICLEYESLAVPARRRESTGAMSSTTSAGSSPAPSSGPSFISSNNNSAGVVARNPAHDAAAAIGDLALPPASSAPPAPLAKSSNAAQSMRSPDNPDRPQQVARKHSPSPTRANPSVAAASPLAKVEPAAASPAAGMPATQMADHVAAENVREELVLALVTQTTPGDAPLWELLDNAHFRRALAHLQPAFEPLSSWDARRAVFPRLHAAALTQSEHFVRGATTLTVLCRSVISPDRSRVLQWLAVDQDARSELLAVTSHATGKELAARARAFVQQLRQQLQQQQSSSSAALPIVHLCVDSVGGAAELTRTLLAPSSSTTVSAADDAAPTLVGGCMAQQTLLVLRDVLESLSIVSEALDACMLVAAFVRSSQALQHEMECAAPACPSPTRLHSFIVCVREVLALQTALRRIVADSASATLLTASDRARAFAATVRDDTFWQRLAFAGDVLAPIAQLLVLTDTGRASSAQLLLCWLQLRDTVNASTLVSESTKAQLTAQLVARMRARCDDHAIACLVLDPRVHALGLSAHGKRKARVIVADLSMRLQPQPVTQQHRVRLIEQLLKYLTRERPFDDADSWRMMASMPRLFWLEFRAEMPELAAVALAVLSFHAHVAPLEETWRAFAQQQRRARSRMSGSSSSSTNSTATESSDADNESDGHGNFNSSVPSMLEVEQVKLGFAKIAAAATASEKSSSSAATSSSTSSSSAEIAHAQSVCKFRKCLDNADANAIDERANTPPRLAASDDSDRDAVHALQQFRRWLERYGAADGADASPLDADSSLQRFDAEWFDSSPDCAKRVRAYTAAFTLGSDVVEPMEIAQKAPDPHGSSDDDEEQTHAGGGNGELLDDNGRDSTDDGGRGWQQNKQVQHKMDAARRLLRTPPSPSSNNSPLRDPRLQHAAPQAEWSSPSFTRARARPSNLHTYLRASPSFPLHPSQQQQSQQNHQHHQSRGYTSDAPSSSSGRAVTTNAAKRSELRSQRTQATQTLVLPQGHASANDTTSVHLGSFGDVRAMSLDTVDFLIRVLEDRKQELLVPPDGADRARRSTSATTARVRKSSARAFDDEYTESSDASDGVSPAPSPVATSVFAPAPPTRVVRSRSYEALVQLEGILEARHQQLMNNGVLEPGAAPYELS